jgi:pimeloyl-ACP methyl ester carboxylesterase
VEGRAIRGFSSGAGPAVLLVHGWGERAATLGAFIEPLVASGKRVVGIDLPGHGRTSRGTTDIFELSRAVRAVADELGGLDAVIAHSMGGMVTAVALNEGLAPRATVLIAPATNVNHIMEKFTAMFALPPRAATGLRRHIERRFGAEVWTRLDITGHARRFRVPTLIVHDRDDPQVDVSDAERLAAAWPGARSMVTTGVGHDKVTREPEVVRAVTTFLTTADSRDFVSTAPSYV